MGAHGEDQTRSLLLGLGIWVLLTAAPEAALYYWALTRWVGYGPQVPLTLGAMFVALSLLGSLAIGVCWPATSRNNLPQSLAAGAGTGLTAAALMGAPLSNELVMGMIGMFARYLADLLLALLFALPGALGGAILRGSYIEDWRDGSDIDKNEGVVKHRPLLPSAISTAGCQRRWRTKTLELARFTVSVHRERSNHLSVKRIVPPHIDTV